MIHPSRETLDQEIEQQTRLVRGLMAGLYARIDSDPDESLLRELAKARRSRRSASCNSVATSRVKAAGSKGIGVEGIGIRPI